MRVSNEAHLQHAYIMAAQSPDPSSQNGAIFLPDGWFAKAEITGYNHIYPMIPPEYEDRALKLNRIEHAERDAIYYAAEQGTGTADGTLVCPWIACYDCARAIIGVGITKVVCHKQRMDLTDERWKAQIDEALGWLSSSGVDIDYHDGPISDAPTIRISGRKWSPSELRYV